MRTCSTDGRPGGRFSLSVSLAFLLSVGTIQLVMIAGCGHQVEPVPDYISVDKGYLGNTACMDCHRTEFEEHRKSYHAVTMREVKAESMGKFMPKPGSLPGTDVEIFDTLFGPAMGWKDKPESMLSMQYALGSERMAFTFILLENDKNLIELRESFFTQTHSWSLTPGHESMGKDSVGQRHEGLSARGCLSCHVTALPAKGLTPEPRFFGVGCESCHGPGKKHVDAVKAGDKNLYMHRLGSFGAKQLNELCGRCHRTEKDLAPEAMKMTQRFAPYGLMKSRCFLESGDTLSCLNCHEAHKNASADNKTYERACLKCHAPSQIFGPSKVEHKACPVNPRTGCIPCHMPKSKPSPDSPLTMADHYIRVFSTDDISNHEDLPFELPP